MKQLVEFFLTKCVVLLVAAGTFLLLVATGKPQLPSFPVPVILQRQLDAYRGKNDLTNWIYAQLQWVSASPAERAPLLDQTVAMAWRTPGSDEERQAWLDLLQNEGHAQLLAGNIIYSTDAYSAALRWAVQHSNIADDNQVLEYILKPLGNNYTRLGDYEQALYIQRRALDIALSSNDPAAIAGTYSNLATTTGAMGLATQSMQYCREGLKRVGDGNAQRGLLLCEQADAYFQLAQAGEARQSVQEGIRLLEKKTDATAAYWLLMAYQQAGDICRTQPAEALQYYNKALNLQAKLLQQNGAIRRRERAKLFYRMGSLQQQLLHYTEARHWLQECLGLLAPGRSFTTLTEKDVYGENTLVDVLYAEADNCRAERQTAEALRLYHLCFTAENKLRNEYITGASRERSVADSRRRYETAIDAAYSAWEQTHAPAYSLQVLQFIESSKARLLLDELEQQQYQDQRPAGDSVGRRIQLLEKAMTYYERSLLEKEAGDSLEQVLLAQQKKTEWELAGLRRRLRAERPSGIDKPAIAAPAAGELIAGLEKQQAVRSFFTGSKDLYTVEIGGARIQFVDKEPLAAGAQDSIRQFIRRYFQDGAAAMLNHPQQYYQQAYTIYHELFGKHDLQAGMEYILLPDGVLNMLPVEALVTSAACPVSVTKWPFVLKQVLVSYAWSLQTLQAQRNGPVTGRGFSGFFIDRSNAGAVLEAVAQEKQGIARTVKKGDWLMDEQATAAAFRKALEEKAVIHISTHAFAGKDSASVPHIRLYDAPFYLFELKGLEHHPAVVVLSACRTGDGRFVSGEGVQSLARAFTACGTNGVVAGWWNINDEATGRLVQQFYAAWAKEQNAAKALRQSKLDLLDDAGVAYQDKLPYYWAALNYHGNPVPLQSNEWMGRAAVPGWVRVTVLLLILLLLIKYSFSFFRSAGRQS